MHVRFSFAFSSRFAKIRTSNFRKLVPKHTEGVMGSTAGPKDSGRPLTHTSQSWEDDAVRFSRSHLPLFLHHYTIVLVCSAFSAVARDVSWSENPVSTVEQSHAALYGDWQSDSDVSWLTPQSSRSGPAVCVRKLLCPWRERRRPRTVLRCTARLPNPAHTLWL